MFKQHNILALYKCCWIWERMVCLCSNIAVKWYNNWTAFLQKSKTWYNISLLQLSSESVKKAMISMCYLQNAASFLCSYNINIVF